VSGAGESGEAASSPPDEPPAPPEPRTPRRRLTLDDPLPGRAGEDRPEAWGEQAEGDAERLRFYRQQRPPHHGS
jgi:hypothetical protein